jgi:hypothetical protein
MDETVQALGSALEGVPQKFWRFQDELSPGEQPDDKFAATARPTW